MQARWLAPALVLAFARTASAQAPGETSPEPMPLPPSAAPVVIVADPCGGCIDPMRNRFSIGVNFGGMGVSIADDDSGNETQFSTAELSIAYRLTPHFDLQLLLSGGRQTLEDGSDGDLAIGGGTLAARYRFRPDRAWNWWLLAGLGTTVIERHESTKEQRDAAQRGHFAFGIGLEHRWRHFALNAELRGVAMSERSDAMDPVPATPQPGTGGDPLPPTISPSDVRTAGELSGGQFTIGASFYF